MKIKVFKTEVYITFTFSAFLALLLVIDKTGFLLPIFFAIITHEIGHLIAMCLLSCAPKKIILKPFHIDITGFVPKSHKDRGIICLSGITINAFFFFIFYLIYKFTNYNYVLIYSAASFAVMLVNSLPTVGLDGGELLFLSLNIFFNKDKSMFILKIISFVVAAVLMLLIVLGILNVKQNISIILFIMYIVICSYFSKGEL